MTRTPEDILLELLNAPSESEVLEFKDRKNISDDDMGEYFSALSNEANLIGVESAWIVFGVKDSPRKVVNSEYKNSADSLNALRHYIAENTSNNLSFRNVYELHLANKRVLMFEVPPAHMGVPTKFKRVAYGREGESKVPLSDEKYERIVRQTRSDWSAETPKGLTMDDLDPRAIRRARDIFQERNTSLAKESDEWDDRTFLEKLRVVRDGRVTNAAAVLLGRSDCFSKIGGAVPRIRWMFRGRDNEVIAGEYFDTPLILAVDDVLLRIRNNEHMVFREGSLIPVESKTYDVAALREAINNCIAHQDYGMGEVITIVERDGEITFSNAGTFIPGSVDAVISANSPSYYYRNRYLADVMARIGMVDTMGGGIIRMFKAQMRRGFPMPRYTLDGDHVTLTIPGRALDPNYAHILISMPELSLTDAIALDRVQRAEPIPEDDARRLRDMGLITGSNGGSRISRVRSASIDERSVDARDSSAKGMRESIMQLIRERGPMTRPEIQSAVRDMAAGSMTDVQVYNRTSYVLKSLTDGGEITSEGSRKSRVYRAVDTDH